MIDVSSIKELCRRWYPRIYFGQPEKGLEHLVLLYGSTGNSITFRRVYSMVVLTVEVKTGGSNMYVPVFRV